MVLWKNIFPHLPDHVVQVDIPPFTHRSAAKPGMEIFITHQYVQHIAGNSGGDRRMAFLEMSFPVFVR